LQELLDIISCYKVFPIIATGRWLSPCTLSASNNKTDCHNITFNIVESDLSHKIALNKQIYNNNQWKKCKRNPK
jgi:hypothetical protein